MEVSCPAELSIYVPHGSINLLTCAGTHATAARDQVFAARLQLLPNAPQHTDPVPPHPRMLEGLLQGMHLEYVWRNYLDLCG